MSRSFPAGLGAGILLMAFGSIPTASALASPPAITIHHPGDFMTGSPLSSDVKKLKGPTELPSPVPPGNARVVMTDAGIDQWQTSGTTIDSLWLDLESGMNVEVAGAALTDDPGQGVIVINLIDQASDSSTSIAGFDGGIFATPDEVGPVTLTRVKGSLSTGDLIVEFSYRGGTGAMDPVAGRFTMDTSSNAAG